MNPDTPTTRDLRSSIACALCRNRKVKCKNKGAGSSCKYCTMKKLKCEYTIVKGCSVRKKNEVEDLVNSPGLTLQAWHDLLNRRSLNSKVWDEIYNSFMARYSTEMPFLHPPTIRQLIRQIISPDSSIASADLKNGKLQLLSILTLTARFHTGLYSSEYYAAALKQAVDFTTLSIYNIQAYLMLGLYEWGQTRELSAYHYIGIAIRLAQAMELFYKDLDEDRTFDLTPLHDQDMRGHKRTIEKESGRRTTWSCFIMDRMLSQIYGYTMISLEQLKIQVPCSENEFLFGQDVKTHLLTKSTLPNNIINDDRILAIYIQLVEVFGRLSEWSYGRGGSIETKPPWDSSTTFFKLQKELGNFIDMLPSNMIFTQANLSAYIEKGYPMATTYVSIHTLYSQCIIMLHREYIQFIPPLGPFHENHVHGNFWEKSAEDIFQAATDIVDIVQACQDKYVLLDSPQIGFAVWLAAFVCVYANYFQQINIGEYLYLQSGQISDYYPNKDYMGQAENILVKMVPRLKMAQRYLDMLGKMRNYFSKIIPQFQEQIYQKWSSDGDDLKRKLKRIEMHYEIDETVTLESLDSVDDEISSRSSIDEGFVNSDAIPDIEATPKTRTWASTDGQIFQGNTKYQQSLMQNLNSRSPPDSLQYQQHNAFITQYMQSAPTARGQQHSNQVDHQWVECPIMGIDYNSINCMQNSTEFQL